MIGITKREIVLSSTDSWESVDVSSCVNTNAAAVLIEMYTETGQIGVRPTSSTDERIGRLHADYFQTVVKLDDNKTFEFYRTDTDTKLYVIGFVPETEGDFFVNSPEKTVSSSHQWKDVDISPELSGNAAAIAFFQVTNDDLASAWFGLRENGSHVSGPNLSQGGVIGSGISFGMMSTSENVIETYLSKHDDQSLYLTGYLFDSGTYTTFRNYIGMENSISSYETWQDISISGNVDSARGVFVIASHNDYSGDIGIRSDETEDSNYGNRHGAGFSFVKSDPMTGLINVKMSDANQDLQLFGITTGSTVPLFEIDNFNVFGIFDATTESLNLSVVGGLSSNSGVSLYTKSWTADSGSLELYLCNIIDQSGVTTLHTVGEQFLSRYHPSLHIISTIQSSGDIPLFADGSSEQSLTSNTDFYIYGYDTENNSIPLHLSSDASSQDLTLYVSGLGIDSDVLTLSVEGLEVNVSGDIPLYVGALLTTSDLPLYIYSSTPTLNSNIDLMVQGNPISYSGIKLSMWGGGYSLGEAVDGGTPVYNGNLLLYIRSDGIAEDIPLFIDSKELTKTMNLFVDATISTTGDIPLSMPNVEDTYNTDLELYTHGF